MKRIAIVVVAANVFLQVALAADAKAQETRPRRAPVLTNEDLLSPGGSISHPSEEEKPTTQPRVSSLRNARMVLEGVLTKMAEVKSLRTRIRTTLPGGPGEVLIETMKPNRVRVVSSQGELIVIGGTFYLKPDGGRWQVNTVPSGAAAQSEFGFDFGTFVKQMLAKPGILIAGYLLADQILDGVESTVYEFEITDRFETGTIQVGVAKGDGYMRHLSIFGPPRFSPGQGGITVDIWFTNIGEPLSIQPPM